MKLYKAMRRRFPCAATWATRGGRELTVADEGICFVCWSGTECLGAIDDEADLNAFAAANGWTPAGTTYTTLTEEYRPDLSTDKEDKAHE